VPETVVKHSRRGEGGGSLAGPNRISLGERIM